MSTTNAKWLVFNTIRLLLLSRQYEKTQLSPHPTLKRHEQSRHFYENWALSIFPENMFCGVVFQNVFSPKVAGPEAPSFWFRRKSEEQFGGPRTIWWWSDLPKIPKIEKLTDLTIQCDQIRRHRVPESCAPFSRTLPSCQNPINCHMGQNISSDPHFPFFPVFPSWSSIGPLFCQ